MAVVYLAVATLLAQSPPSTRTLGEVTAVDATARSIQLKTVAGVIWTVSVAEKALCVSVPPGEKDLKKATPIQLDAIKPGDRMLARGEAGNTPNTLTASSVIVMTKADLAQKHARDRAEWMRRSVAGAVNSVDAAKNEIVINTRTPEGPKPIIVQVSADTQYRRYAPDSVKFADAKPGTLAEIQPGDQLRALGDKTQDGTRVTAEEIVSGAFQTIAGTVISTDPAAGAVRITDLLTTRPVTVMVKEGTLARRLPEMVAGMLARRLNGGAAGAGAPGNGAGGGQWQQRQAGGAGAAGGGWQHGPGGAGTPGGSGGPGGTPGRGQWDMQQMLERLPPLSLADLKKGDALVVSSSRGSDPSRVTALTVLAGVEPLLAAAPRVSGNVNAGSWNLDIGMPGMPTE